MRERTRTRLPLPRALAAGAREEEDRAALCARERLNATALRVSVGAAERTQEQPARARSLARTQLIVDNRSELGQQPQRRRRVLRRVEREAEG
eukprot:3378270-Pleurochrysis_carterae.AAC.1